MAVYWFQLWGIVRYEARLVLRRRSLIVLLLALLGIQLLMGAIIGPLIQNSVDMNSGITMSAATTALVIQMLLLTVFIGAIIFPLLLSDTVPRDTIINVQPIIASLPLSPRVYLLGKVLAMWAAGGLGLLLVVIFAGLGYRVALGQYDLLKALGGALIVMPVALYSIGMGVLLPFAITSRRQAIFVGLIFLLIAWGIQLFSTTGTVLDAVFGRIIVFIWFLFLGASDFVSPYPPEQIVLTVGMMVMQLLVILVIGAAWLDRRDVL